MKGESQRGTRWDRTRGGTPSTSDAESVALEVLNALVRDPDRLGRFLSASGLDPATIREAASGPGFLAAVLDHVAADEGLLGEVAGDLGMGPERIMTARAALSPEVEWSP